MSESLEVGVAEAGQQVEELLIWIDAGAQHHGPDEHADHIVEHAFSAPGRRRPDGEVVTAGEPRQYNSQSRVQHHERRRAMPSSQIGNRLLQDRFEMSVQNRATTGSHRGAGPIQREFEDGGQAVERVRPERELARDQRGRRFFRTQHLELPQRVIRVLHLERRPRRLHPSGPRLVRHHHITRQRTHRETVTRNVMHRHRQHELELVELEQMSSHGNFGRDVERRTEHLDQQVVERILFNGNDIEDLGNLRCLDNLLVSHPVVLRVHSSQDLVTGDHVGDTHAQRLDIQRTYESKNHRDAVRRRTGIEPVEEPHTSLRR
ncbi:hypothetical protein BKP42_20730 [Rhodococcus erythropolis]|nr:hypothetical protein BKP42_20730 [Rhodococcus erythropolis]